MPCTTCKKTGHNARTCNESASCPICMASLSKNKNYIVLVCGHEFCSSCILHNVGQALSDKCPLCRTQIVTIKPHTDTDDPVINIIITYMNE
jgi:hypothetical protein